MVKKQWKFVNHDGKNAQEVQLNAWKNENNVGNFINYTLNTKNLVILKKQKDKDRLKVNSAKQNMKNVRGH